MLGRTNAGGSGSGGTLTVTGVVGDAVTVSKDSKIYSRTFNSSGIATFKGLKTGAWTVTMTDGTSTASRTVTIDSDYTLTITYFSATINVTYPEGSTCTATDGTTTLTAPDTSGTWACVVPNAGTWTVTCTNGEQTKNGAVSITTEGQVETVTLTYGEIIKDGVLQEGYTINEIAATNNSRYKASVTYKTGYVNLSTNGTAGMSILVDCTYFTTLTLDVEGDTLGKAGYTRRFAIRDKNEAYHDGTPSDCYSVTSKASTLSRQEVTVSLEGITGEKYFVLSMYSDTAKNTKIYNMTLS